VSWGSSREEHGASDFSGAIVIWCPLESQVLQVMAAAASDFGVGAEQVGGMPWCF